MKFIKKILSKKINLKIEFFSKKKIIIYCTPRTAIYLKFIEKKFKKDVIFLYKDEYNLMILILTIFRMLLLREKYFFVNYLRTIVELCNIRVFITDLDNYTPFYSLKSKIDSIKVLLIQNGTRAKFLDVFEIIKKNKENIVDDFIVFNNDIKKKYEKYVKANYHILGSYKLESYTKNFKAKKKINLLNTILYISQYRSNDTSNVPAASTKIIQCLQKFSLKNNIKLKINFYYKLNNSNLENEKNYYKKLGISNEQFITNKNSSTSYQNLLNSKLVVSCDSTMGYESLSMQRKTFFTSIIKGSDFAWPGSYKKEGFFWLTEFSQTRIEKKIKELIKCKNKVWIKKIKEYNKDIAFQDFNYSKKIEKIIKGYLI